MELKVNGQTVTLPDIASDPAMPLLWALRDGLNLTGTKFGCGIAACGACTVHVDGQAVRSCVTPLGSVQGRAITTIEGLRAPTPASTQAAPRGGAAGLGNGPAAGDASKGQPHALQLAWLAEQVPQCGYCQSGMLMAAAALLAKNKNPSDADIDAAMTNLCRCGTYPRVRAAIKQAAKGLRA